MNFNVICIHPEIVCENLNIENGTGYRELYAKLAGVKRSHRKGFYDYCLLINGELFTAHVSDAKNDELRAKSDAEQQRYHIDTVTFDCKAEIIEYLKTFK